MSRFCHHVLPLSASHFKIWLGNQHSPFGLRIVVLSQWQHKLHPFGIQPPPRSWLKSVYFASNSVFCAFTGSKKARCVPPPLQQMNCFHAVHFELTKYARRGPDTKGSLLTANKHDSMMPLNSTSRFGNSIAVCNVKRGDVGQNRWNNAILVQVTWLPMDLQRWQSQLFPSCKATVRNRHEVTSYVRDCPLD